MPGVWSDTKGTLHFCLCFAYSGLWTSGVPTFQPSCLRHSRGKRCGKRMLRGKILSRGILHTVRGKLGPRWSPLAFVLKTVAKIGSTLCPSLIKDKIEYARLGRSC